MKLEEDMKTKRKRLPSKYEDNAFHAAKIMGRDENSRNEDNEQKNTLDNTKHEDKKHDTGPLMSFRVSPPVEQWQAFLASCFYALFCYVSHVMHAEEVIKPQIKEIRKFYYFNGWMKSQPNTRKMKEADLILGEERKDWSTPSC